MMKKQGKDTHDNIVTMTASGLKRRRLFQGTIAAGIVGVLSALAPSELIGRYVGVELGHAAFAAEATTHAAPAEPGNLTADEALKQLLDGNARYVASKQAYPDQSTERRLEVAKGQHPIAVVLGCADSRVAPELLFDQGLGSLFVLRVAGNITDDVVKGSIEFGVEEFHIPLVVVLGHERCGAVKATLDASMSGGEAPGHIGSLVTPIKPAVEQAKLLEGDTLDLAIIANVANMTEELKKCEPLLSELVHAGKLRVVGARYDLDTGEVTIVA